MIDLSKYDSDTMFVFSDGSIGTDLKILNYPGDYKYRIKIISDITEVLQLPYNLLFNKLGVWRGGVLNFYIAEIIS